MTLRIHTWAPFVTMGAAGVLIAGSVTLWTRFGPRILINETASEPVGLYRLLVHPPPDYRRGMYVVFPVPRELHALVYGRHWLRSGIPFLKELLGLEGDRVCISADRLEINEHLIGPVFSVDSQGLPLPQHPGCFAVPSGHFFAASRVLDKSFDGRYFGALPLTILTGEARPIWTF